MIFAEDSVGGGSYETIFYDTQEALTTFIGFTPNRYSCGGSSRLLKAKSLVLEGLGVRLSEV